MIKKLIHKIVNRWRKLSLAPISVFVFHQVSDEYNPLTMWECDWTQIDLFKRNILALKQKYTFISLIEAYNKLQNDWFRRKKYAVLTSDDGYLSLMNILPWLEDQQVPVTLFINAKYMDKQSWSAINEEQALRAQADVDMKKVVSDLYLSKEQVFALTSPLIEIGLHGYEHTDATQCTHEQFFQNVELCERALQNHPRYIPFMAYTWGHKNAQSEQILKEKNIIPVLVNGSINYTYRGGIDRQALDRKILQ